HLPFGIREQPQAGHLLGHPIYPLAGIVVSEADQQAEATTDGARDAALDRHRCSRDPLKDDPHVPPPGTAARAVIVLCRWSEPLGDTPASRTDKDRCDLSLESAHVPKTRRSAALDRRPAPARCIAPAPHRPDPSAWADDRLTVSWLGHATVL